jgi:hypothetical protein
LMSIRSASGAKAVFQCLDFQGWPLGVC